MNLLRKILCSIGFHEWDNKNYITRGRIFYARCKHCGVYFDEGIIVSSKQSEE